MLSACARHEISDRLSHRSLNSDALNILLKAHLDTHHGHLHIWTTHLPGRESVCYDNRLIISLSFSSLSPVGLIWYHKRVFFFFLVCIPNRNLKGKPISLCSLLHLISLCSIISNFCLNFFSQKLSALRGHRDIKSEFSSLKNRLHSSVKWDVFCLKIAAGQLEYESEYKKKKTPLGCTVIIPYPSV